uniref:Uncharacterized protein n=1 Tax=Pipistrellus kuhlii TaxID=59472 RepID=A0A7J7RVJ6_PIPKU|nr:hypothetical protein mPipKuh1_010233 [Pipistrellus kuhlii]
MPSIRGPALPTIGRVKQDGRVSAPTIPPKARHPAVPLSHLPACPPASSPNSDQETKTQQEGEIRPRLRPSRRPSSSCLPLSRTPNEVPVLQPWASASPAWLPSGSGLELAHLVGLGTEGASQAPAGPHRLTSPGQSLRQRLWWQVSQSHL